MMGTDVQARRLGPLILLVPLFVVMLAFYVWPLVQTIINSFRPYSLAGIDFTRWTMENYTRLADPFYVDVFLRTLRVSLVTTVISCALVYPVAIFLTSHSKQTQAWLVLIYLAPWLVNVVVKAFGWSLILGGNGIINRTLRELGLISAPLQLMFNETGIIIGLVQGHFLFVLLPLWAALSALDPRLKWAAANLGASKAQVFLRVTLPITLPALLAGAFINLTMNMAAFATPALLGGSRARVISFVTYEVNLIELNWPFGGALAMALLVLTLVPLWLSRQAAIMRRIKATRT